MHVDPELEVETQEEPTLHSLVCIDVNAFCASKRELFSAEESHRRCFHSSEPIKRVLCASVSCIISPHRTHVPVRAAVAVGRRKVRRLRNLEAVSHQPSGAFIIQQSLCGTT